MKRINHIALVIESIHFDRVHLNREKWCTYVAQWLQVVNKLSRKAFWFLISITIFILKDFNLFRIDYKINVCDKKICSSVRYILRIKEKLKRIKFASSFIARCIKLKKESGNPWFDSPNLQLNNFFLHSFTFLELCKIFWYIKIII